MFIQSQHEKQTKAEQTTHSEAEQSLNFKSDLVDRYLASRTPYSREFTKKKGESHDILSIMQMTKAHSVSRTRKS